MMKGKKGLTAVIAVAAFLLSAFLRMLAAVLSAVYYIVTVQPSN